MVLVAREEDTRVELIIESHWEISRPVVRFKNDGGIVGQQLRLEVDENIATVQQAALQHLGRIFVDVTQNSGAHF